MKIQQSDFNNLSELKPEITKRVLKGRFYNINRDYVVEADGKFKVVRFTLLERIKDSLLKIVGKNYFKERLHAKIVRVIPSSELKKIDQQVSKAGIAPPAPGRVDPNIPAVTEKPSVQSNSTITADVQKWVDHIVKRIKTRPNKSVIKFNPNELGEGEWRNMMLAIQYMVYDQKSIFAYAPGRDGTLIKATPDDIVDKEEEDHIDRWQTFEEPGPRLDDL